MIFKIIKEIYWRFNNPEKYAKHLGVSIGKGCLIATRRWSSEPYLIKIGNNVQVTEDVWFHTHGGCNVLRKEFPNFDVFGKIEIKDWAYIGSGTHILPGITIGEGALVAAGSIVTKSVPPYTVVGGNPAKIICSIDEYKKRNMRYNINTYSFDAAKKKILLLQIEDKNFIKK